jgi:hypothetical protein
MGRLVRCTSPATVIAGFALFVALGGTSVAAVTLVLPRNSVGTAQLKSNAVNSAKVKNASLLKADFAAGQLPAGPAGPAGAPGPAGSAGPPGPAGAPATKLWATVDENSIVVRSSGSVSMNRVAGGLYRLTFPVSVTSCAAVASVAATSAGNNLQSGEAAAAPSPGLGANIISVATFTTDGSFADKPFTVEVVCP